MQDPRFIAAWHHLNAATVGVINAASAPAAVTPQTLREALADALTESKLATLKIQELLADPDLQ
jgi:hypothetical protein